MKIFKFVLVILSSLILFNSQVFAQEVNDSATNSQAIEQQNIKEKSNAEHAIELNLGYTNRIFKKVISDISHELPVNLVYRLTLPDNFTFWLDTMPIYLGTTTSKEHSDSERFPFSVGTQVALLFGYTVFINDEWRIAFGAGPGIGMGTIIFNDSHTFSTAHLNFRLQATKMIDKKFGVNIILQDGVSFNRANQDLPPPIKAKYFSTIGNNFAFQFGFFFKVGGK